MNVFVVTNLSDAQKIYHRLPADRKVVTPKLHVIRGIYMFRKILRFGSRFKSQDYLPAFTHKENFTITKKKNMFDGGEPRSAHAQN